MSNASFSFRKDDDDLKEYYESLPNASETIRRLLRDHRDGVIARADERSAEIDDEVADINEQIDDLKDRRTDLKDERARLEETKEKRADLTNALAGEAVELFGGIVTIHPDDREKNLGKRATVSEDVWRAVLENVDLHHFDKFDGRVTGGHVEADLRDAEFNADVVLDDSGALSGATVTDDDAAEYLAGLSEREREEIRRVVNEFR